MQWTPRNDDGGDDEDEQNTQLDAADQIAEGRLAEVVVVSDNLILYGPCIIL